MAGPSRIGYRPRTWYVVRGMWYVVRGTWYVVRSELKPIAKVSGANCEGSHPVPFRRTTLGSNVEKRILGSCCFVPLVSWTRPTYHVPGTQLTRWGLVLLHRR
jgi:hypothetical protein